MGGGGRVCARGEAWLEAAALAACRIASIVSSLTAFMASTLLTKTCLGRGQKGGHSTQFLRTQTISGLRAERLDQQHYGDGMHKGPLTGLGTVKFWKAEKGWGAIVLDDVDFDVWGHFSAIDMPGYRAVEPGQRVFVEYEMAVQDSFRARAIRIVAR
jgi:CspA family cold shock protein